MSIIDRIDCPTYHRNAVNRHGAGSCLRCLVLRILSSRVGSLGRDQKSETKDGATQKDRVYGLLPHCTCLLTLSICTDSGFSTCLHQITSSHGRSRFHALTKLDALMAA